MINDPRGWIFSRATASVISGNRSNKAGMAMFASALASAEHRQK